MAGKEVTYTDRCVVKPYWQDVTGFCQQPFDTNKIWRKDVPHIFNNKANTVQIKMIVIVTFDIAVSNHICK